MKISGNVAAAVRSATAWSEERCRGGGAGDFICGFTVYDNSGSLNDRVADDRARSMTLEYECRLIIRRRLRALVSAQRFLKLANDVLRRR
jgi:hypothetical protein